MARQITLAGRFVISPRYKDLRDVRRLSAAACDGTRSGRKAPDSPFSSLSARFLSDSSGLPSESPDVRKLLSSKMLRRNAIGTYMRFVLERRIGRCALRNVYLEGSPVIDRRAVLRPGGALGYCRPYVMALRVWSDAVNDPGACDGSPLPWSTASAARRWARSASMDRQGRRGVADCRHFYVHVGSTSSRCVTNSWTVATWRWP